ncbi:MAG: hypothetical protein AAGH15_20400 [Myxococcota bacterium]
MRKNVVLFGLAGLVLVACASDDLITDSGVPGADAGVDAGVSDAGIADGRSAYLVVQRNVTPDGRSILLSVLPDLAPRSLDGAEALELPGASRARTFEGKVFGMDSERGVITRFAVDDSFALVEEDRLSMTRLGISLFFGTATLFLGSERAIYVDPPSQQVVLWNPSEMVIEDTVDVPELRREDFESAVYGVYELGGEILVPVGFWNLIRGVTVPTVTTLVFSAADLSLQRVIEDDRCAVTGGGAVVGDRYFVVGDSFGGAFDIFAPDPLPAPCVLRRSEGSETLDPDFLLDLRAVTGAPHVQGLTGGGRGGLLTRIYASDVDPDTLTNPFAYSQLPLWRYALLDAEGSSATVADELPLSTSGFGPFVVDGDYYVPVTTEGRASATLYRLGADGRVEESVRGTGEFEAVARVR